MPHPDVVIVGAGMAGLAVAAHLSGRARTVVLEQAAVPASAATAQGVGMARRLVEDPVDRALALRTVAWLEATQPPWSTRSGAVIGALHDATWLNDAVAHVRAQGIEVLPVAPEEVAPITAGGALRVAWWVPSERLVDPVAMSLAFLASSAAEVRCGVTVTGLTVENGRLVGVDTTQGRVSAGAVVLAAGAWCASLAAGAGLVRPLFPLRRTVFVVPDAPPAGHPWVWIDDLGLWARPDAGQWSVSPCDEAVDFPVGPDSSGEPSAAHRLTTIERMSTLFPSLRAPTTGWTGLRTFAPDRRPLLGPDPALPGLFWAAGLGGSGVTLAPAIGEAVAAGLCGEEVPWINARWVAPDRPQLSRWPVRPDGRADRARLLDGRLTGPGSSTVP